MNRAVSSCIVHQIMCARVLRTVCAGSSLSLSLSLRVQSERDDDHIKSEARLQIFPTDHPYDLFILVMIIS